MTNTDNSSQASNIHPFSLGLRKNLELFFRFWSFLAAMVLLVVWALPHTIAVRNIALYSGALAAMGWFVIARSRLSYKMLWPSICLLLVPLWVLMHWYWISELQQEQWEELTSTWLRVTAAVILGTSVGLMIARRPRQMVLILLALCCLPIMTFLLYLQQVYLQQHWILPSGMFYGPFKGKFSEVYFVLCQALVGYALITFAFTQVKKINYWTLVAGTCLILIAIADCLAARALNGILVIGVGSVVCLIYFFLVSVFKKEKPLIQHLRMITACLVAIGLLFSGLYAFWAYDQRYEGKLSHLIGDVKIASQIDNNQSWTRNGQPIPDPVDGSGRTVNGSTYERVSWFIKGLDVIQKHPLGNGISHRAFGYYMRAEFLGSTALMTHSAWVDYTLGLGLPGLFLAWAAIFGVFSRSLGWKNHEVHTENLVPIASIWLILGLFCFWIIGEVSEREYLEHYFFLIALFGSSMALIVIPKLQMNDPKPL